MAMHHREATPLAGDGEEANWNCGSLGSEPASSTEAVVPTPSYAGAGFIKVCVRVRPFNSLEKERGDHQDPSVKMPTATEVMVTNPATQEQKTFSFDRAYWSADERRGKFASQKTLMEELGHELKDNALDGFNSCLFAYGQTGSGKTYSVLGNHDESEHRGLLPRIVEEIFAKIKLLQEDEKNKVSVSVSYLEIYNEQIRDLLNDSADKPNLEVRHCAKIGAFVPGAIDEQVSSWEEVEQLLELGLEARAVGSTLMNQASSRSHCIFTMEMHRKVVRGNKDVALRSKLKLVDLAGSERQKKTQATGSTLKEASNINRSLAALAQCVSKLADMSARKGSFAIRTGKKASDASPHVPFRNSKLTFLLQDSIGGNSKTIMVAALSPAGLNYEETLSTLNFAKSVKRIETKAVKNEDVEADLVKDLEQEVESLRKEVAQGRAHEQEVKDLEEIKMKYGNDLEQQLSIAKKLRSSRSVILADGGLTPVEMSESVGLSQATPQLLNMCYDPQLCGCLVYFVQQDVVTTVGTSQDCRVQLEGLGMEPRMAVLQNEDNQQVSIKHIDGRVLLNGRQVQGSVRLMHNDRLIFGFSHCFQVVIRGPDADQAALEAKNPKTIEKAVSEIVPECSEAYQECVFYIRNLQSRIGETRAAAFLKTFRRVCVLVEEANAILREMRPFERLEFSPEVLTDLFESGAVPECAVRLKKLSTGSARWRMVVQKHFKKEDVVTQVLKQLRANNEANPGPSQTVLLLTLSDFQERLRHFRDLYESWRRGGHAAVSVKEMDLAWDDGGALREEHQQTEQLGASLQEERHESGQLRARLREVEQQLQEALAKANRLSEAERIPDDHSRDGCKRVTLIVPGAGDIRSRRLPCPQRLSTPRESLGPSEQSSHSDMMRGMDSAVSRLSADRGSMRSMRSSLFDIHAQESILTHTNSRSDPRTSRQAAHDEMHRQLLDQVHTAFEQGLACGRQDSRALRRHLQRLEAVEADHFQSCRALREHIGDETRELEEASEHWADEGRENARLREEAQTLHSELQTARYEARAEDRERLRSRGPSGAELLRARGPSGGAAEVEGGERQQLSAARRVRFASASATF